MGEQDVTAERMAEGHERTVAGLAQPFDNRWGQAWARSPQPEGHGGIRVVGVTGRGRVQNGCGPIGQGALGVLLHGPDGRRCRPR